MDNEVRIVRARLSKPDPDGNPHDRHVDLAPVIYDLDSSPILGARPLNPGEAVSDFAEYVDLVTRDMLALSATVVHKYANEWARKATDPSASTSFSSDRPAPQLSDLYVRLLVDFSELHPELIANMLATMLTRNIQATAAKSATRTLDTHE